jgi:hypothetical protein
VALAAVGSVPNHALGPRQAAGQQGLAGGRIAADTIYPRPCRRTLGAACVSKRIEAVRLAPHETIEVDGLHAAGT